MLASKDNNYPWEQVEIFLEYKSNRSFNLYIYRYVGCEVPLVNILS